MLYNILKYYDKLRMHSNIYKYVKRTPLTYANQLSNITNNNIYYKREDMQNNYSFNIRGSCMKLMSLTDLEKKNGIVVYGTNNYVISILYLANIMNINTTIMLQKDTQKSIIYEITKFIEYNNTNYINKENNINIYLYDSISEIQKNKTIIDIYNDDNICLTTVGTNIENNLDIYNLL